MSRARERREAARMKRQAPDHFPDVKEMVGGDAEHFEWMDGEQPEADAFKRQPYEDGAVG